MRLAPAPLLLAATLTLGAAASAAPLATAAVPKTPDTRAATSQRPGVSSLPDADRLSRQAALLSDSAAAYRSVSALLRDVLAEPGAKLPTKRAERHQARVEKSLTPLRRTAAPERAMTRGSARTSATPAASVTPRAAKDLDDAVDALVTASVAGDLRRTTSAITGVVQAATDLMGGVSGGGLLPAAKVPGTPVKPVRPAMPGMPGTSREGVSVLPDGGVRTDGLSVTRDGGGWTVRY